MKAEYICADQPVNFIVRLRQSGGPYILVCSLSTRNCKHARELANDEEHTTVIGMAGVAPAGRSMCPRRPLSRK
jgi:hypothetical protein